MFLREVVGSVYVVAIKNKDFAIPAGLSKEGRKASETILKCLSKYFDSDGVPSGGGCRAFYTPAEWKERGEEYGLKAELIVVHDGGDLAPFFNMDYEAYEAEETMVKYLAVEGLYSEACTCWYTAIYKNR